MTGAQARKVLMQCLVLHIHVLRDWECKSEYTRTLAVALLGWQPYYSGLPGCCFVEETCEALLSRMVARRRENSRLTSFEDVWRLYMTLPSAQEVARGTRGSVQQRLVDLIHSRVVAMVAGVEQLPFARMRTTREARWEPSLPLDSGMPAVITSVDVDALEKVLQGALVSLAASAGPNPQLRAQLNQHVPAAAYDDLVVIDRVCGDIRAWGRQRRDRQAAAQRAAQSQSQPRQGQSTATTAAPSEGRQSPACQQPPPQHTGSVSASSADAHSQQPPQSMAGQDSQGGSLYMPPPTADDQSQRSRSPAASDGLGSVGNLELEDPVHWEGSTGSDD